MSSKEITLEDLHSLLTSVKSSKETTDTVVAELKNKVGDHELAIVTMVRAVEDMNKTFTNLAETFKDGRKDLIAFQKETSEFQKQYQIEQVKHWGTQDGIMREVRALLEIMGKYDVKFHDIEQKQLHGCPNFTSFKEKREIEMKHWEEVKGTILKSQDRNRDDIDLLVKQVGVLAEKMSVSNNRTADLEKFEEDFGKWKDTVYRTLVGNSFVVIGAFVLAAWNYFTK